MALTLESAKEQFVFNPYVQEFTRRKAALLVYAITNKYVSLDGDVLEAFGNLDADRSKIELNVSDIDFPNVAAKNTIRLLSAMSSIPNDLFFLSKNDNIPEKELEKIIELDIFRIKNFMEMWNLIIKESKQQVNCYCEKFTSL